MAYSVQKKNNGNGRVSANNNQADIQLSVNTPEGDYLCQSLKNYTEKASIVQDLDQTDSFIKLSSFSKNFAALTVHLSLIHI